MSFNRGQIVLVLYPDSNLRTAKRRPALIVQADNLQTGLPQLVVSMITSKMFRAGHLSRVEVLRATPIGEKTGLKQDSVIMTDNLMTIYENEIERVLGEFSDMSVVDAALRHTLGL